MAKTFTVKCAPHVGFIPTSEDASDYLKANAGKLAQVKVSMPRSLEQNAMLWAVADVCFETLPEKWAGQWSDKYRMVKGLQLALGIVDEIAKPTKQGSEIIRVPSSIADMDREEATKACDLLFAGMARLLGTDVATLLNETQRRAA